MEQGMQPSPGRKGTSACWIRCSWAAWCRHARLCSCVGACARSAEVLGSGEDQVTKGGARLNWRVMAPLAFSDSEFSAQFPKNCTATGSCSLKTAGGKDDHDEIKVTTLDKFVKAEGLDKADIDLLRINAEGYDPKVRGLRAAGRFVRGQYIQ